MATHSKLDVFGECRGPQLFARPTGQPNTPPWPAGAGLPWVLAETFGRLWRICAKHIGATGVKPWSIRCCAAWAAELRKARRDPQGFD